MPSPAERIMAWFSRLRGQTQPPPESEVERTTSIPIAKPNIPSLPYIFHERYRLDELIGRGGTGAVYRAHDTHRDRLVAVKLVRAELLADSPSRKRFRLESQAIAELTHPSIVAIFDYGTFAAGGGYLVMELVHGHDLRHELHREGCLEPDRAIRILSSVCHAVEAAHRAGVLHRDLKPENILLPEDSDDVKVFDFGVRPAVVSVGSVIMGTPAYMAPEQFNGAPFDARCDVFSLGVLAYEILEGELPFGGGAIGEIVLAHAHGPRPMQADGVPTPVARAIATALDTNPDHRPSSALTFAHLLAASAGHFDR